MNASPAAPRALVIAMRSYTGSRVALLNAAARLLAASKSIELGGAASAYKYYGEEGQHFLAAAVLYRSSLSVNEILDQMNSVERRLSDSRSPEEPRTLVLDLLWVEGVEVVTPEITLPSPLLENERWANMSFAQAGEDAVVIAAKRGTEREAVAKRIAQAYKRFNETPGGRSSWIVSSGGPRSPSFHRGLERTSYENAGVDEADVIAAAGDLIVFAREERRGRALRAGSVQSTSVVTQTILKSLYRAPLRKVESLSVSHESGLGVEERALAWTRAVREHEANTGLRTYLTVVFSLDKSGIRGAVLGDSGTGLAEKFQLPPVESVKVTPFPRAPSPTLEVSVTVKE